MARVTVEDCLTHEENRPPPPPPPSQRARQLLKGAPALVRSKNRPAITALREIASERVHWNRRVHEAVDEFVIERKAADAGR